MKPKTKGAGVVAVGDRAFVVGNSLSLTLAGEPAAWLNAMAQKQVGYENARDHGAPSALKAVFCKERARFAALLIEEALGAVFASGGDLGRWQVCPRLEIVEDARPRRVDRVYLEWKGGAA